MTREQGLNVIEKLFIYENPYIYKRVKFFFIAPDGTYVSYLDDSPEEVKQHLLSFMETDQGKAEIRIDVNSHISAQDIYMRSQLVWRNRRNVRFEPRFKIDDRSNEPKGWRNLTFISRVLCFEDSLASYQQKTAIEKEQFITDVLEVIHETFSLHGESRRLYSQALRLLIGPKDFFGRPWNPTNDEFYNIFSTSMNDVLDARNEQPAQIPDMYAIGIKANAFRLDKSYPGKYLLIGNMQTAFRKWFDALDKKEYKYSDFPMPADIENLFATSDDKHSESSILDAYKKVRSERSGY